MAHERRADIKVREARQREKLTSEAFSKAEKTHEWWQAVIKDPRFQDIIDAAKREKPHAKIIHDTQHGMNYVAGHNAGFDEALDILQEVHMNQSQTQQPEGLFH